MSHFSYLKTRIRDLKALQSALNDLDIDWKPGPSEVRGYQGQTCTAHLIIEQPNSHDIGFAWNGHDYDLVADFQFWKQPLSVEGFLRQVTQRYAYQKIMSTTIQQGFEVAEQQHQKDGSIRLVLQRWR
ncbi:MAG: DUF1257 domain-containing protein [Cyanobacteria bacterium P01_A01_bin.123]